MPDCDSSPQGDALPPTSIPGDAEVVVRSGKSQGYVVPVCGDFTIGRATDCQLQLFDDSVSRRHSRIVRVSGLYHIEDLGSHNGTGLNGARVQKHILYHGDEIRCGDVALQFLCRSCPNPKGTAIEMGVVHTGAPTDQMEQSMETGFIQMGMRDVAGAQESCNPSTERLLATCHLVQQIAKCTGWQDLFQLLLESMHQVIPFDRMVLCRYNAATHNALPVSYRRSPTDAPGARLVIDLDLIERSCGETRCIAQRREGGNWMLAAPMLGTGRPQGVVYLETAQLEDPKQAMTVLAALCRQSGLILEQEDHLSKIRHQKLQVEDAQRETARVARAVAVESARLEIMLQSLSEGALLVNDQGEILKVNEAGRAGLRRVGRLDEAGRVHSIGDMSFADLRAALAGDKTSDVWEVAEGDPPRHYSITAFRMPLPLGTEGAAPVPWGLGILFRDITERRQAEEALGVSEEQLRQAQKMEAIGRLAGGVAHDFNNMLTVIGGYTHVVLDCTEVGDPRREPMVEIQKAAARAASLTRQLLAFSRKEIIDPKILDLNEVVVQESEFLRRLIGEEVRLFTNLGASSARVKADAGQLGLVLMNLAVNARDAMLGGGKMTIETANVAFDAETARRLADMHAGRYVLLAVSDTGHGMDRETLSHIFEPFFTTKDVGKGTGLGLATVYGAVRQNGGFISVYSQLNVGTTFKIYLPSVEPAPGRAETPPPADPRRGHETVLVAEDEEMVRKVVVATLVGYGYRVLEADCAGKALELAKKHECRIDLLVTDVVMPEVNGRELARRLTEIQGPVRILYTSGYTDSAIVNHGVLEQGMAFLQKPFTPKALARKVREILDAPKPER